MDLQDTIFVKLTPKASHNRIGEEKILPNGKSQLMVYVTAVAENGKANEALIKLLAKYFKLPKSRIYIFQGETSRNKVIKIK